MKVYISGKISGLPITEAEERFRDAEDLITALNLTPVNPLKNGLPRHSTWEEHMTRDIEMLKECEVIFMLDNWEDSRGARIECDFAVGARKVVMFENMTVNNKALQKLTTALHEITGLTLKDITEKGRSRQTVFARMIFAWNCRNMRYDDIGLILNRNRTTIDYYINKYSDELKFNPVFARIANMVEKRLQNESIMVE